MLKDKLNLQVEITTNCQSMCRGCNRFVAATDVVNPNIIVGSKANMRFDVFKEIFAPEVSEKLHEFFFTGAYGENTMHPQFKEFLQYGLDHSNARFQLETNGGLHSTEWWADLARMTGDRLIVRFGIDGTDEETHAIYRRNVSYNKVIENARAFIDAGGYATWEMIEFSHNAHQIEKAKELSDEYGFKLFKFKGSRAVYHAKFDGKVDEKYDSVKLTTKRGINAVRHSDADKNTIKNAADIIASEYGSQEEYNNFCEITCRWEAMNKFNIDYDGVITRCCYLSSMYKAAPGKGFIDGNEPADSTIKKYRADGYQWYKDKYGETFNHLAHHPIVDILTHEFFEEALPDSLNNPGGISHNPRIANKCPQYCGELVTKYNEVKKADNG